MIHLENPTNIELEEHEAKLHSGAITTGIKVTGKLVAADWKPKIAGTVWHQITNPDGTPKVPLEWLLATNKVMGF